MIRSKKFSIRMFMKFMIVVCISSLISVSVVDAAPDNTESTKNVLEETITQKVDRMRANLPRAAKVNTGAVLQTPELPTGCESVALTMALNSFGYGLAKTTIADDYLIHSSSNLAAGYMGDPRSTHGAGVFPPGLVNTANAFLEERQARVRAVDVSGGNLDTLYCFIAAGLPVVVWTTMYFREPVFTDIYSDYEGRSYHWYSNEHCVMLGGYDLDQGTVTIYDPLQGEVTVDAAVFAGLHEKTGEYALTIM